MALTAGTCLGPYEVLGPIGAGGMGEVHRARDPRLGREVALKLLPADVAHDEDRLERFELEARAAAALNHSNVVTVYDVGTHEGTPYVVMELLEGETLRQLLRKGPLAPAHALDLATQVARGLAAAHDKGIVHRDLKPENLFLTDDGRAKILDFGLAKLRLPQDEAALDSGVETASAATAPGAILGTVGYMSPEQVRGERADQRSDIFSFGAVLYEMLSGRRAFGGDSAVERMHAIVKENPAPLAPMAPTVPPALERLVHRCLEKRPQDRFPSARDLGLALEAIAAASGAVSHPAAVAMELPFPAAEGEEPRRPVFVGREQELAKLESFLGAALAGRGRMGFVVGEAGSGKTALVAEFCGRAQKAHPDLVVAGGNCSAHTGLGDPYLPFREVLGQLTGDIEARWAAWSISRDHAVRLWSLLPAAVQALVEKGPDLLDAFIAGEPLQARGELCAPGGAAWRDGLSRALERKTAMAGAQPLPQAGLFTQYARVLQALARGQPLLLVLDDLQWADSGSLDLLFHLGRHIEASRILILGLYRPAEVAAGRGGERHPLEPVVNEVKQVFGDVEVELGREEDRAFVEAVIDREPNALGPPFREALFLQTRGHALFTVELLRGLREQGRLVQDAERGWVEAPGLSWDALPARAEAAIAERIGRLPERLQRVLELASLEGEEFTAEVVARLEGSEAKDLISLLSGELDKRHHLVRARGIVRVDGQRLSRYRFGHILVQKYLDQRLDAVERAQRHEEAGRALEDIYGERADEVAVELARHYEEAGLTEKAVEYLHQAGLRANQASAYQEAIAHHRRALGLLGMLPEKGQHSRMEAGLQIALGWELIGTQGFASVEAERAFTRARMLREHWEPSAELFWAVTGLAMGHGFRAEYEQHQRVSEQALQLAQTLNDPGLLSWALELVGDSHQARGDWKQVVAYYERALAIHAAERDRDSVRVTLLEHAATVRACASAHWWGLGWPDKALRQSRRAVEEAENLSLPTTLAMVAAYDCGLHILRGEVEAALQQADRLERLAADWDLAWYATLAIPFRGWCLAQRAQSEEAVVLLQTWLPRCRAAGVLIWRALFNTIAADACLNAGATQDALDLLEDARAVSDRTGERQWVAELLRVHAEILLRQSSEHQAEAEQSLRQAIDVARRQETRSLELRSVTSLSRLLRQQGRNDEARRMLGDVYGWFTEGFDTKDLKDARALLEQLG